MTETPEEERDEEREPTIEDLDVDESESREVTGGRGVDQDKQLWP